MKKGRRPIIGYAIVVKMNGTRRNSGSSANDLPKKYVSVR